MSDLEASKDLVRRFYEEVINQRDLDAIDRPLAEDFTHDGEVRGRDGQRQAVVAFLDGFSDLSSEILMILAEDELVSAHQRWSGTHDGEFIGIPATGRRVQFTSTAILRITDGQIAAAWDEVDLAGLMGQLQTPE